MSATTTNNYNKTKAQRFYEFNQNATKTAELTNKIGYKESMAFNLNQPYPRYDNVYKSDWLIQSRSILTSPNQNFVGRKSSRYVAPTGRFKIGLYEPNDSRQKMPDSSVIFTKSQVPRMFQ
jgi:hypothetical protein